MLVAGVEVCVVLGVDGVAEGEDSAGGVVDVLVGTAGSADDSLVADVLDMSCVEDDGELELELCSGTLVGEVEEDGGKVMVVVVVPDSPTMVETVCCG